MRVLALLCCSLLGLVFAADDSQLSSVELKKLNAMRSLVARGADGLATLEDGIFNKYALNANRPYHLFVVFNARDPRHNCAACGPFEDEVSVLADSYNRMMAKDSSLPEVFFARAEYASNQNRFKTYNMRNVPVFAYFPPTEGETGKQFQKLESPYVGDHDAENAANYVRGYTGVQIDIYRSPVAKLIVLGSIIAFIVVMFRYASDMLFSLFEALRSNRPFWMIVCISVYVISISGVLYDIIRGVPMIGADREGRPLFINPQSGTQFGAEGLIVGFLNVGAAASVLLLTRYAPKSMEPVSVSIGCLLGFAFFYYNVIGLYRLKNRWYLS